MKTWTQKVKEWNTDILKTKRVSIWKIHYRPEYRYISLSGDGLLMFRGTISMDGKKILVTAVNAGGVYQIDDRIKVDVDGRDCSLQPHVELTIDQFEKVIKQYTSCYS